MVVYLNNAGQAELTSEVKAAGVAAIQSSPWQAPSSNDQARIRELFASLIDAEPSDIAIMPSTAFAISLAARNVQRTVLLEGGKILLLQDQFNSAVYPWQQVVHESNGTVSLDVVPHSDNWTKAILARIENDAEIRVACLPPLHWSNGALIDLERISAACRSSNVTLIVDATQAVGIMPVSVKKVQPAFLACSVHKWLRAPAGTSLVYISDQVRPSWIPLDFHGRGRDLKGGKNWDAGKDCMGPTGYPEEFFHDARKFDSGGKPNPVLLPMLRASLEQVILVDPEQAQELLKVLMDPLIEWAENHGYKVAPEPRAYHLVGIEPPNRTTEEVVAMGDRLKELGIIVAVRCGGLRVSPYQNTPRDIQKLIKALESLENSEVDNMASSSCSIS